MSSPQSRLGISEQSSISELISVLHLSFQKEDYDEVERLMTSRVNKLQTELYDLKKDFVSLRGEHDSLKSHYSSAVLDKSKVEQELMNCKCQLKESRQHLDKKNGKYEELHQTAKKIHTRYKCVAEELKAVELEREYKHVKMNDELAKKDEELMKVREENEASLAEMADKLKVVKEENETLLAEMTEKLAKKDREFNQLWTERNVLLEDLVARILFLEQDMKKYRDDAMHKKTDQIQEAVLENFSPAVESSVRKGSCDGAHSGVVSKNGGLEAESPQNAVSQQAESEKMPNTLPTAPAEPSKDIPVIDLSSDGEEEDIILTFRAKAVNGVGNKTPLWGENGNDHRLKRDRSGSCTSDSADSFCQEQKGKKRAGNNGCEVQDTAQSKEGKAWLEELFRRKEMMSTENNGS